MTRTFIAFGLIGALAIAGCNVTVNNDSVQNQLDAASNDFGNVADAADRAAEHVGNAIENQADALENGVDVNVNLRGREGDDNANKQ
jgi:hypothetical protein